MALPHELAELAENNALVELDLTNNPVVQDDSDFYSQADHEDSKQARRREASPGAKPMIWGLKCARASRRWKRTTPLQTV